MTHLLACLLMLAAPPAGRKLALVVGVNRYDGMSELEYAVNDAAALAEVLRGEGCRFDRVLLLTSDARDKPTAANIRKGLTGLLAGTTKADTVLIALAGHGVQVEVKDPAGDGPPRKFPFFCPSDADLTTVKYQTGHSPTMINLDDLFETLGRSNARVKLVLIDACRNELKVKGSARGLADKRLAVPDGVLALFSCGRRQKAYECAELKHGLFFHHVLEGLRGRAKDDEGDVTWASLGGYTTRNVTRDARDKFDKEQTPATAGYFEGATPILARPRARPKGEERAVTSSIGMKLVLVPAGEFVMGSPEGEKGRRDDEKPRPVKITKAFHLGMHEVTQGQFKKVMGYNPSYNSRDGKGRAGVEYKVHKPAENRAKLGPKLDADALPVENVSWDEAKEFCDKLTALEKGRSYRLPTEAEWEYACRAGTKTAFSTGERLTKADANFLLNLPRTTRVGEHKSNGFGLYDVHGNVAEWCADYYEKEHPPGPASDPVGPGKGFARVFRGGNWQHAGDVCRSASRRFNAPDYRSSGLGFRVVRD